MKERKANQLDARRKEADRKCKIMVDGIRSILKGSRDNMVLRLNLLLTEVEGRDDFGEGLDTERFDLAMEVERLRKENRELRRERSVSEMQWAYAGRHKEMFEDYMRLLAKERMGRTLAVARLRKLS